MLAALLLANATAGCPNYSTSVTPPTGKRQRAKDRAGMPFEDDVADFEIGDGPWFAFLSSRIAQPLDFDWEGAIRAMNLDLRFQEPNMLPETNA